MEDQVNFSSSISGSSSRMQSEDAANNEPTDTVLREAKSNSLAETSPFELRDETKTMDPPSSNPSQSSPTIERQECFNKPPPLDFTKTPQSVRRSEICFSPDNVFGMDVEIIDLTSDESTLMSIAPSLRQIRTPRTSRTVSLSHMLAHPVNEPDTPTHRPASSVPQRRKRDPSLQPSKSQTCKISRAMRTAQINSATTNPGLAFKTPPLTPARRSSTTPIFVRPPKSATPTPVTYSKTLGSPSTANQFTPSRSKSSRAASPPETLDDDSSNLIPFCLKSQTWTPWLPSEYFDLSREMLVSFDYKSFAACHNRHPADVLAIFQAMVIRPLRQAAEATKRGESGMAELFSLFQNHGTAVRTWARGSGFEIVGKLENVSRGEVVVVGECAVGKDLEDEKGTDKISKNEEETVVIPVQVLSAEDWRYLNWYALNEDQRQLLSGPKKQSFEKAEKNIKRMESAARPGTPKKKNPYPKTNDIVVVLDDNAMRVARPEGSTTPSGSPRLFNNCSSETLEELEQRVRDELSESSEILLNNETFKKTSHLFDDSGKVKRFSFSGAGSNSLFTK